MSHVFRSKDHTAKSGDEISYSFVHDSGLCGGGMVTILAFNESKLVQGPAGMVPEKIGELEVHKDALAAFVAALVRSARVWQLEEMNDMGVLGL